MNDSHPLQPSPREREVFLAALELTDPAERGAFLAKSCAGNPELLARIQELLGEQHDLGTFLANPALADTPLIPRPGTGPHGTALLASVSEKAGDRIGRYRLLQQIGEGGCGIVFMAEQEEPVRRRVALKVIKLGMDTKSVIARFEAERQALAMMDHQNISRVLDAGATETGRPYFVMELVRGVRITDYCDQNKLGTPDRLKLIIQVCLAVQHAHQKGIIHRDLKPSNILVTVNDGVPVPKVIDFGIAKATEQRLTEKTLFTEFTAFIGTPAYMSPEQAEMSSLDIDTRSDIYALGVLLYELLTGRPPFDPEALMRQGLDECRRTIREKEPERPSTRLSGLSVGELTTMASQRCTDAPKLLHSLQGDLDWIVMKCLEKDRTRRFPTANALANDLQRYLENEPVLARPPSNWYRLQKMLRRHRLVVGATAAITLALVGGATISTWQAIRATRAEEEQVKLRRVAEMQREEAREEKAAARQNEYIADMSLAQQSLAAGNFGRAVQLVEKHRPQAGEKDLRGFEWRYLWQLCRGDEHLAITGLTNSVQSVTFAPDGRMAVLGARDRFHVLDLATHTFTASRPRETMFMAFRPDGRELLTGSRGTLRVWNTQDWSETSVLKEMGIPGAVSPDGTRLALQTPGGVRLLDLAKHEEVGSIPGAYGAATFSPDGKFLATDSMNGLTLWPLAGTGQPVVLQDATNVLLRLPWFRSERLMAFSPDGHSLAVARNNLTARGFFVVSLWDTATGQELGVMPGDPELVEHTGMISGLCFSPDGQYLATASFDHSIRLWDIAKRKVARVLHGHRNEVWAVAFSPDGKQLLTGSKDGTVHLWPVQQPPPEELLPESWLPLAFAKDSRTLAALKLPATLGFYNLATREWDQQVELELPKWGRPGGPGPMGPGPGGPNANGGPGGPHPRPEGDVARPGPGPTGGPGGEPGHGPGGGPPGSGGPPPGGMPGGGPRGSGGLMEMKLLMFGSTLGLSADLKTVVQATGNGMVQFTEVESKEVTPHRVGDGRVEVVALSPDGQVLLTSGRDRKVSWWEFHKSTNAMLTFEANRAFFSPDGKWLASIERSNSVQIWDVAKRTVRTRFVAEPGPGEAGAFSPDGRILATAPGSDDFNNGIQLWSTETGKLLGSCYGHKQPVQAMAFAPEGMTLASAAADGTIKLWNLATQQELLSSRKSGSYSMRLLFSPDGQWLIGTGFFENIRLFKAPSLKEIDRTAPPVKSHR